MKASRCCPGRRRGVPMPRLLGSASPEPAIGKAGDGDTVPPGVPTRGEDARGLPADAPPGRTSRRAEAVPAKGRSGAGTGSVSRTSKAATREERPVEPRGDTTAAPASVSCTFAACEARRRRRARSSSAAARPSKATAAPAPPATAATGTPPPATLAATATASLERAGEALTPLERVGEEEGVRVGEGRGEGTTSVSATLSVSPATAGVPAEDSSGTNRACRMAGKPPSAPRVKAEGGSSEGRGALYADAALDAAAPWLAAAPPLPEDEAAPSASARYTN